MSTLATRALALATSAFSSHVPRRSFSGAGRVALVAAPAGARARRALPSALSVTASAGARLKELLAGQPDALGVRLGVKTRGCNGVSYTMTYATSAAKFDEEVREHGVRVFIEPSALLKIAGTVMDWREDDTSAEFVFSNPNAAAVCGCGESFST